MLRLGFFLALATLLVPPLWAGTAMAGRDQVDLLAPYGVEVTSYSNIGYELLRSGRHIRIRVNMSPLGNGSAFRLPPPSEVTPTDDVTRLARALAAGADNHYAAISRILGWVSANIDYDLDRQASQGAGEVLGRRSAYCTGYARLSVALLRSVGIEAREVAGIVLEEGPGGEAQFHRWIEVHYPGVGWSFSDPARSHHFVPATYLRLASSRLRPDATRIPRLLLDQLDDLVAVDIYPYGPPSVLGRRNTHAQRASALRITTEEGLDLTAELDGAGFQKRLVLRDGEGTFLGLGPGIYRVRVTGQGYPGVQGRLRVAAGERQWLRLPETDHHPTVVREGKP